MLCVIKFDAFFSQYKPSIDYQIELQRYIENAYFVCGGELLKDKFGGTEDDLHAGVYMRDYIKCTSDMEKAFHITTNEICTNYDREMVCYLCGGKDGSEMADIPEHLADRYTKVLPLCKTCKTAGHDFTCGKKWTKAQAHQRAKKSKENKELKAPLATEVEDGRPKKKKKRYGLFKDSW